MYLNGAAIAGYSRKKCAEKKFAQLMKVVNNEKDVLYCWDRVTGLVFVSNELDVWGI